jgi:Uma2 family endonuclease
MTTTKLVTVDEFMRITDDGRFDLIDGEVQSMAPASAWHGESTVEIVRRLGNYAIESGVGRAYSGETAFVISRDPDTVLCPDAAFVRAERLPPRDQRMGALPFVPDLAVEVRSPSESGPSLRRKIAKYFAGGTQLVWVIDPQRRTATVHQASGGEQRLSEHDRLDGGELLPGFSVNVGELFA